MANLAASAVTTNDSWTRDGGNSKKFNAYNVTVVLAAMGTATNKILASAFGLVKITGTSNWIASDNSVIIPACPSIDGTYILLGGGAANVVADYTATFKATVWGSPV